MSKEQDEVFAKFKGRYGDALVLGYEKGDVIHELPMKWTDADKALVFASDDPMYAKGPGRLADYDHLTIELRQPTGWMRHRLNRQHKDLRSRMSKTSSYILVHNFRTYQANYFVGLVWLFVKTLFTREKKVVKVPHIPQKARPFVPTVK